MMSFEFEWVFIQERGLVLNPLPAPEAPGPGAVLVRPKYVGICGSDLYSMRIWDGEFRPGHEWVGKVEAVGADVSRLRAGDVVTSVPTIPCFHCEDCSGGRTHLCGAARYLGSPEIGALRSWMVLPAEACRRLEKPLSPGQALHEVVAVAEQGVRLLQARASHFRKGELAIFGAGAVGQALAIAARACGEEILLIEKRRSRVEIARKLGLNAISLAQALIDPRYRGKFRSAVDATSDHSRGDEGIFRTLPQFMRKEFYALIVAKYADLPALPRAFFGSAATLEWMRGISLETLTHSVAKTEDEIGEWSKEWITHVLPANEAIRAFDVARDKENSLRVILEF